MKTKVVLEKDRYEETDRIPLWMDVHEPEFAALVDIVQKYGKDARTGFSDVRIVLDENEYC
jgi:hypothetical protein